MSSTDLFGISQTLDSHAKCESKELDALIKAAEEVGKSFSGSWFGYHSCVYYENFETPPAGAVFSQEWGLKEIFSDGTRGNWRKHKFDDVVSFIRKKAGNPSIEKVLELAQNAKVKFSHAKIDTLSLLYAKHDVASNKFLTDITEKIEQVKVHHKGDFIDHWMPKGRMMSRDTIAIEKGPLVPPHFSILAQVFAAKSSFKACENLKNLIITASNHINHMKDSAVNGRGAGTSIFIGHGNSPDWREVKDFLHDRLGLSWEEFNRVSAAGIPNTIRLSQMLDQSCFAFLIMTAEDERADGDFQARMNVIHEVGLFQGRLGFDKAIVLLEDGCEEFTNIQGLGQIRFSEGKISATFEDIRQVLEREKIIEKP